MIAIPLPGRSAVRFRLKQDKRIARLGERQVALAKVMRVSQQTVSKKLRGECAILVSDLEKIGKHYKVPMTYFFEEWEPEVAWAIAAARRSAPLRKLLVAAAKLPGKGQLLLLDAIK